MTTKVPHSMTEGIPSQVELNDHKVEGAEEAILGHVRMWIVGTVLHIETVPVAE